MKVILSLALLLVVPSTTCFGFPSEITFIARQDLFEISGGSTDGLQKGLAMAVVRRHDDTYTYLGKLELFHAGRNHSVCRVVSLVPKVLPKEGDMVIPFEWLSQFVGQVTSVKSNDAIEVSLSILYAGDRLRVYRETQTGIAEVGQLNVVTADKDRLACKVRANRLKTPIQPGDKVAKIYCWKVQSVDEATVTVPVGADDGLSKGSRLLVYEPSYCVIGPPVGRIEVVKVESESCVCKVLSRAPEQVIAKGDRIIREELVPVHIHIEGQVVAVSQPETVEVNVGSDQKLRKGDVLQVHRSTNGMTRFVGDIIVVETSAEKSVCRVDRTMQVLPIETGDKVEGHLRRDRK